MLSTSQANLAGTWYVGVGRATRSSPGVLFIGTSNKSWGSISLPRALDSMGAPSCSHLVEPLLAFPGATNSGGGAGLGIPLPDDRRFDQVTLYAQHLVLDVFANSAGFVISNGGSTTFGLVARMMVAWSPVTATSASRVAQSGTVSGFEYR
ncbi:MAG: hypothetical protein ACE5F1_18560 [Planctomycetota bacterium]